MAYVMKLETWMDLTNTGMLRTRSSQLKMIDQALKAYHQSPNPQSMSTLKLAMHHWKMLKGYDGVNGKPAWVSSDRNKRGAVTALDMQIFGVEKPLVESVLKDLAELPFYGVESWAEDNAREAMKQARDEALHEMFQGRELVFRKTTTAMAARSIKKSLTKAKQCANETAAAATKTGRDAAIGVAKQMLAPQIEAAREIIKGILEDLPLEIVREVMRLIEEMIPNFIGELAAAITPYIGVARSGAKTTKHLISAIKSRYQSYDLGNHTGALLPGDPEAAAVALLVLVRRETAHNTKMAGIYGTDTVLKGGALALDAASFGVPSVSAVVTPLSGMITALAVLAVQVRALARDVQEKTAANKLLKNSAATRLNARIFQDCPLLGVWFLSCANTSDILNFLVSDIGQPGWKLDVEVMVSKHIAPIIKASKTFVADARFEVSGMSMAKGATASTNGTFDIKAKLKKKMITKVGEKLPFVDKQNYQTFAANQGQQTVSPQVLKSRITGMGSS